jgi:lipoprotein NlpD
VASAAPALGASSATAPASAAAAPAAVPAAAPAGEDDPNWMWPAGGSVLAGFDEAKNKGLDIGGNAGDPVLAASDGRVVYAGEGLRGYGKLIILKHNNVYLTAYAHNRSLLVKEDATVKRGQKIAEMGDTDADRVKLHFEVRKQGKPVDPAKYMPSR